ncbi:TolC family protein [Anaeromyxobacter dehalogenans]|uniref:Outer membrane efflux protein n=1 Tax=Anaeromyxobacter dehalogenans (strain 2CP-C) TaxID=290397 RepID=Q2IH58_ANADE|nr:TolC family protein [Anaeromyxobacter dehalogenans]ABC83917.1 outer membrane efflux protein [Anaeromyxobacter dehalogenans 2CP-C]
MRSLAAALLLALASATRAQAPITLDDALAQAARANADLSMARADRGIAAADRGQARAAVLPRLDLDAGFGHSFIGRATGAGALIDPITGQVTVVGAASDSEAYSASLSLSQPLFDWARFKDLDRARWGARATDRGYDETALSVSFEVTRRFYDLVKQERSLEVLQKTVTRSQELVDRAEALFTAGRAPKSDTYSARVNLQNDRIAVEGQRMRVAQARTALAQVLGRIDAEAISVVAPAAIDAPGVPGAEPPAADALVARARERRPAVLAQAASVHAARAAVGGAQAGYLPTVSAVGSYARQGTVLGGQGGVYGDPGRDYSASAQVVLSWNLFEGFGTSARVQRASASLDRARADEDRTLQAVAKEIGDARAAAVTLAQQVALATDTLAIAQQSLALATERLEAGLANQLELRDANLKLTQAELSLLESRIDHAVAIADLARAAGGTL